MKVFTSLVFVSLLSICTSYEVLYAVNFGNVGVFTDSDGIQYEQEASSYTKSSVTTKIIGATENDQKLYQSHSLDLNTLIYFIPHMKEDGKYLLVVKYYDHGTGYRMNITLNEKHLAVSSLSAYELVGAYRAYDEFIFFSICDGYLQFKNHKSPIKHDRISVKFQSTTTYHIYLSALVVVKGDVKNFPVLPSLVNRQSKDAEISLLYQQLVHKCDNIIEQPKVRKEEVAAITKDVNLNDGKGKLILASLPSDSGLRLLLSNFTFTNLNVYNGKNSVARPDNNLVDAEFY